MQSTYSPRDLRLISIAALLFGIALSLGGGSSRDDEVAYILVPVASVSLLGTILFSRWLENSGTARSPMLFLAAVTALTVSQLIPLPPSVWQALPGREIYVDVALVAGIPQPWRPVSLSPDRTTDFVLAMLPIVAVLLLLGDVKQRLSHRMVQALLGLAMASTLLAALQLGDGPSSGLRFYRVSNSDAGVGFFANRNHQAALLAMAIPAAGWWMVATDTSRIPPLVRPMIGLGMIILFFVGGIMTGSRMGLALCVVALAGSVALIWPGLRARWLISKRIVGALLGAAALALGVFAVTVLSAHRLFERAFYTDLRSFIWPRAIETIQALFPVGSGFGTFDRVYPRFERIEDLRPQYVNRAHNDLLEIGVEGGLGAYLLFGFLLVWFAKATVRVWREPAHAASILMGRLASIIVALALAASVTDYPLRTAIIASVFAAACAILQHSAKSAPGEATSPPHP